MLSVYKLSINNQHYALNCTTPLFNILDLTCFGSSLPSSGNFLDPSWVTWNTNRIGGVSHNVLLCGLCTGVSRFRLCCFLAEKLESTTYKAAKEKLRVRNYYNCRYVLVNVTQIFAIHFPVNLSNAANILRNACEQCSWTVKTCCNSVLGNGPLHHRPSCRQRQKQ
jgi:hypothetical protein